MVHVAWLHCGVFGGFWRESQQRQHLLLELYCHGVDVGGCLLLVFSYRQCQLPQTTFFRPQMSSQTLSVFAVQFLHF